jgi:hypothetical protein
MFGDNSIHSPRLVRYRSVSAAPLSLAVFKLTRHVKYPSLTTWLHHSKKKTCDVCKAEYAFEKGMTYFAWFGRQCIALIGSVKVYDPNMPQRLPPLLFMRRLAVQLFQWHIFGIRAIFVSSVWLALLPYMTVHIWRFYFWGGQAVYELLAVHHEVSVKFFVTISGHGPRMTSKGRRTHSRPLRNNRRIQP